MQPAAVDMPVSSPSQPAPAWLDKAQFPFILRRLRVPAGSLSYVDEGQGPVVLLVHGTPSWSFEYRHLIAELARDHRVIAIDHMGFGLSERPSTFAYTPEAHAANLKHAVQALGLRSFCLVVHDFGGPIGLPLALDPELDVQRVVCLNTWMWPFDDAASLRAARFAGSFLGRMLYKYANASLRLLMPAGYANKNKLTPRIHGQYLAPFAQRPARVLVLWRLARALIDSAAHYEWLWTQRGKLLRKPVLLLWGVRDRVLPLALLDRWSAALPHARVVRFEAAGHWPQEEEPHAVNAAVRAFLSAPLAAE